MDSNDALGGQSIKDWTRFRDLVWHANSEISALEVRLAIAPDVDVKSIEDPILFSAQLCGDLADRIQCMCNQDRHKAVEYLAEGGTLMTRALKCNSLLHLQRYTTWTAGGSCQTTFTVQPHAERVCTKLKEAWNGLNPFVYRHPSYFAIRFADDSSTAKKLICSYNEGDAEIQLEMRKEVEKHLKLSRTFLTLITNWTENFKLKRAPEYYGKMQWNNVLDCSNILSKVFTDAVDDMLMDTPGTNPGQALALYEVFRNDEILPTQRRLTLCQMAASKLPKSLIFSSGKVPIGTSAVQTINHLKASIARFRLWSISNLTEDFNFGMFNQYRGKQLDPGTCYSADMKSTDYRDRVIDQIWKARRQEGEDSPAICKAQFLFNSLGEAVYLCTLAGCTGSSELIRASARLWEVRKESLDAHLRQEGLSSSFNE